MLFASSPARERHRTPDGGRLVLSVPRAGRPDEEPRYSALVLLATFASLRWGEASPFGAV